MDKLYGDRTVKDNYSYPFTAEIVNDLVFDNNPHGNYRIYRRYIENNRYVYNVIYVGRVANRTSDSGLKDRLLEHIGEWTGELYFECNREIIVFLKRVYNKVSKHQIVNKIIREIGKCSYDIYLFQMAVFTLFTSNQLSFIENNHVRIMLWMVIAFLASIVGGVVFNKMKLKIESF